MIQHTDDQLLDTIESLRHLLNDIFDTSDLFTFDDLLCQIVTRIHIPLEFLIYVRDRSWFDSTLEYLTFPYLSFSRLDNITRRFSTPQEVDRLEDELLKKGFDSRQSKNCKLVFRCDSGLNIDRVLSLILRIIVAFYKNCGYHSHFRRSVATRFVRDFFKSDTSYNPQALLDFISGKIGIDVTLWYPKDEMFFNTDAPMQMATLLRPFPGTISTSPPTTNDERFLRDLQTSVLRMNRTTGVFEDDGTQYLITTFAKTRITGLDPSSHSYKQRQKAVAIFRPKNTARLSLDAVYYATCVIEQYLRESDSIRVSHTLVNADAFCFYAETELAKCPAESPSKLSELVANTLEPTAKEIAELTQADRIYLWIHDPFINCLVSRVSWGYGNGSEPTSTPSPLNVAEPTKFLAARCFQSILLQALNHPLWIESELSQNRNKSKSSPNIKADREKKLLSDRDARRNTLTSGASQECSALALPIRIGDIVIGVLEVISTSVGQLTIDTTLLERFATICGNTLRRLELANDRAWLARMSFVYACRHRIASDLREIETQDPEIRQRITNLINMFDTNEGLSGSRSVGPQSQIAIRRIIDALQQCKCRQDEISAWIDNVNETLAELPREGILYGCLADITETLTSNHCHSDFQLDAFRVSAPMIGDDPPGFIEIVYEPEDVFIDAMRLAGICLAPIRGNDPITFHYGLFLLSSHLRMIGGIVQTNDNVNETGSKPFGLSFRIPTFLR